MALCPVAQGRARGTVTGIGQDKKYHLATSSILTEGTKTQTSERKQIGLSRGTVAGIDSDKKYHQATSSILTEGTKHHPKKKSEVSEWMALYPVAQGQIYNSMQYLHSSHPCDLRARGTVAGIDQEKKYHLATSSILTEGTKTPSLKEIRSIRMDGLMSRSPGADI